MLTEIKTIHGVAILGTCFLVAISLINSSSNHFSAYTTISNSIIPHTQLAQVADVTSGLVGHWTFDEGSGTTANDTSGNGNNGTLVNGPTWTTGQAGSGAILFNGSSQYVSVPPTTSINNLGPLTYSSWIYPSSTSTSQYIFSKNSRRLYLGPYYSGGNNLYFIITTSIQNLTYICNNFVYVNRWSFITLSWNGVIGAGASVSATLNGVSCANPSLTVGSGTINSDSSYNANIGSNAGASNFVGTIDDVRVYNRVLSSDEITTLYNDGLSGGGATPPQADSAPTVPSGLTSSNITSSGVTLGWTTSSDTDSTPVAGYTIYRGGVQIATGITGTTYTDSTLSPSTTYSYTVSAYDTASPPNNSTQSLSLSVTTSAVVPATYTLSVSKSGTGTGTVIGGSISCGSTCFESNITYGTSVTLSANPASGSTFSGWSGAGCFGTGTCTVTLTANTTVTASFSQNQSLPSGGTAYYIDYVGGSDSNFGTSPSSPWQHSPGDPNATNNPMSVVLNPGDTIAFKGGVVYQFPPSGGYIAAKASGSAGSPITYISGNLLSTPWPNATDRAVIDGSNTSCNSTSANNGIISLGNYIWLVVEGLEIRNSPSFVSGNQMAYTAGITWDGQSAGSGNITIKNNYIHDLTMDGVYLKGKWAFASADQVPTNFYITSNTIVRTNGHGLLQRFGFNNVVIEKNYFDLNGTDIYRTGNSAYIQADNIFLEGDGDTGTNFSVQYNTIIRNNIFKKSEVSLGYGTTKSNVFIMDQENVNIHGNVFTGQPQVAGMDIPGRIQGMNIFNNIFNVDIYTYMGPISFYTIKSATTPFSNINIFNNTFMASPASGGADISFNSGIANNVTMLNNIIDGNPDSDNFTKFGYQVNVRFKTGRVDYSSLQINNNVYNSAMKSPFFADGIYYDLSSWKTVLQNKGVSGFDSNSTFGAVNFTNRTGGDFHLSSNDTLAKGQGVNLTSYCSSIPALCADKDGNPRPTTGPWDIGAYEYTGSTSPTPPLCTSFTYSTWGLCSSGSQARTVLTSSPTSCTGGTPILTQSCTNTTSPDFNSDGLVNTIDLSLLLSYWNQTNFTYDLNNDGVVNSLDYATLVGRWSE